MAPGEGMTAARPRGARTGASKSSGCPAVQTSSIPHDDAHIGTVDDAMVRRPKVLPADATVAEVADVLADDHVHMVLLVRGDRLIGTVTRADLEDAAGPRRQAATIATLDGRTVGPGQCLGRVHDDMISSAQRRLAVVDHDGRLLGLLCLKRTRTGFCTDRDVASRAAAAAQMTDPLVLEPPVGSVIPAYTGR